MRHALAILLFAQPLSASADIPPSPVVGPELMLVSVDHRAGADAPAGDREAVTESVRSQLYERDGRVRRCLASSDLREDPLRSRTRRITVVFHFSRSGRPRVTAEGSTVPAHVRSCVLEAARSIRVSSAPRGAVVVRAVYELR